MIFHVSEQKNEIELIDFPIGVTPEIWKYFVYELRKYQNTSNVVKDGTDEP